MAVTTHRATQVVSVKLSRKGTDDYTLSLGELLDFVAEARDSGADWESVVRVTYPWNDTMSVTILK